MDDKIKKDSDLDQSVTPAEQGEAPPAQASEAEAEEIPLTPMGWLAQNGIYIVLISALLIWLYQKDGFAAIWQAGMIALGLGFVIFIHELGHFLAAKWCDVHVLTFSIGFGPAIPGCSFKRGETTYKLSLLPLGGYVNMVGEGMDEEDEEEDYPRSFKNKSVGQRMIIISAGVIMNILLGMACFIIIYPNQGVRRLPVDAWSISAGSPAWKQGVKDGAHIHQIDGDPIRDFRAMKLEVMSSKEGVPLAFQVTQPGAKEPITIHIAPKRGDSHLQVGIGVPPMKTELDVIPEEGKWVLYYNRPLGAARKVDLPRGTKIEEMTDPKDQSQWSKITPPETLADRLWALAGKKASIKVAGKSQPIDLATASTAIQSRDTIIGTTAPDQQGDYDPFHVTELDPDSRPGAEGQRDTFQLRRRFLQLNGKVIVVLLERKKEGGGSERYSLLVPPAYHLDYGLRMQMGQVTAVRENSPAKKAGVKEGDVITQAKVLDEKGKVLAWFKNLNPARDKPKPGEPMPRQLAPMRLGFDLAQAVYGSADPDKTKVVLTVLRKNESTHERLDTEVLKAVKWDAQWRYNQESTGAPNAPLSIPELGVAFHVLSQIQSVVPDSAADKAGLKPDDTIEKIRYPVLPEIEEGKWQEQDFKQIDTQHHGEKKGEWAYYGTRIRNLPAREIEVQVKRIGTNELLTKKLVGVPDKSWPMPERGFPQAPDYRYEKADNLFHAIGLGISETIRNVRELYLQLGMVFSGKVSIKGLGGPVEIVSIGYKVAGVGFYDFLGFIAFISVNLAVINFLPIPLLDGGHMMFLIYEKLRGKPAPEGVMIAANYIGLVLLLSLMVFVFYLDISRRIGG